VKDVEGVVLAAGLSTRSKRFKMTLPLGDKTVIEATIDGMLPYVDRAIVVVGWCAERLRALLGERPNLALVYNAQYREGMFSSVRAGIAQVSAARFFLVPGDQPLVSPEVYERLLLVEGAIAIPTHRGRKGHPVLLDSSLVPGILAQPAEATLRDFVERTGYVTVEVDDEGILIDLDTAEDYAAIVERTRERSNQDRGSDG
jgi:molybdenum cofactor cytidylyltransferase